MKNAVPMCVLLSPLLASKTATLDAVNTSIIKSFGVVLFPRSLYTYALGAASSVCTSQVSERGDRRSHSQATDKKSLAVHFSNKQHLRLPSALYSQSARITVESGPVGYQRHLY